MKTILTIMLLSIASLTAYGQELNEEMILSAMDAEQQRSIRNLKLGDLARPYHIEYFLQIRRSASVHSVLGTVEDIDSGTTATLTVRVRVG
ncbi:MAG: hypothetical protein H7X70_03875, partial [Candidatus Kapabacteria bacterium]|nr:hypothetical protein [Candidatus Kapabacteria bacterium]